MTCCLGECHYLSTEGSANGVVCGEEGDKITLPSCDLCTQFVSIETLYVKI